MTMTTCARRKQVAMAAISQRISRSSATPWRAAFGGIHTGARERIAARRVIARAQASRAWLTRMRLREW
jgi:hypothetical protein